MVQVQTRLRWWRYSTALSSSTACRVQTTRRWRASWNTCKGTKRGWPMKSSEVGYNCGGWPSSGKLVQADVIKSKDFIALKPLEPTMEAKQLLDVCDVASYTVNVDTHNVTPTVPAWAFALKRKPSLITQWLCPDLMSWPAPLFLLCLAQRICEGKGGGAGCGWGTGTGGGGLCPSSAWPK